MELARERGVDEALLAEMDELTGCMATFDSGKPGSAVALRFDIDCVNVQECAAGEYVPNKGEHEKVWGSHHQMPRAGDRITDIISSTIRLP